ncbi:MAG: hypothetical protein Kow0067_15780 [Coriobacteriia bacterium]
MLKPIKRGDRGPAVEDIQKRLLTLGHDLGRTGVDGVFLGATYDAVRRFQAEHGLSEDGEVGQETWSALVDATFRLGDRLLYLKYPYLHGADVRALQGALNALGFACGEPDGIFGAYTERAVREFQANIAQPADGIAGDETVRALQHLRHVWQDKDPTAPVALRVAPARAAETLARIPVGVVALDEAAADVAERIANLAFATEPRARVSVGSRAENGVTLYLTAGPARDFRPELPRIATGGGAAATEPRVLTALATGSAEVVIDLEGPSARSEPDLQRLAVAVLDAVCAALSRDGTAVIG